VPSSPGLKRYDVIDESFGVALERRPELIGWRAGLLAQGWTLFPDLSKNLADKYIAFTVIYSYICR
jgi:hypothetical protein